MTIFPFRAAYPQFDRIADLDQFCERAKDDYTSDRNAGLFALFATPGLYIYQIETALRKHTGLLALNAIADFEAGMVKKHEKTLSEREAQYHELLRDWRAMIKPVLLTYAPAPPIADYLQHYIAAAAPTFEVFFKTDQQTHRVWHLTQPDAIGQVQTLFAEHLMGTYIADGHHRTTTMANLYAAYGATSPEGLDFSKLLCAYFDADQLDILDYNRVAEALENCSAAAFLERIAEDFEVVPLTAVRKPMQKHEIVLLLHDSCYALRWKPQADTDSVILDVTLLNNLILEKIIGITDVRTDRRITYIDGSKGIVGVEQARNIDPTLRVGFLLYPVDFNDMIRLADQGQSMPPKSTYFEPRMKSGLMVQVLDK